MRTKVCTKCGEEKPFDAFYRRKDRRDGLTYDCKTCRNAYKRERRRLRQIETICPRCGSPFKKSSSNEKYCVPCRPLHLKERQAIEGTRWRENNRERSRAFSREFARKESETLSDNYCRKRLVRRGLDPMGITPELISFQRAITKLKRTIKETT